MNVQGVRREVGVIAFAAAALASACEQPTRFEAPIKPGTIDTTPLPPLPPRVATSMYVLDASSMAITPRGEATLIPPTVVVLDQSGHAVPNVRVDFEVIEGGGTLVSQFGYSDVSGRASAGQWVPGDRLGRHVVQASLPGGRDSVRIVSEVVVLDTLSRDRDFILSSLDGIAPENFSSPSNSSQYPSARIELRGQRFTLHWTERPRASSAVLSRKIEGTVDRYGSRLTLTQDIPLTNEYFRTVHAFAIADGRLHVMNWADSWPLLSEAQVFTLVR